MRSWLELRVFIATRYDPRLLLHGQQYIEIYKPLPTNASVRPITKSCIWYVVHAMPECAVARFAFKFVLGEGVFDKLVLE